MTIVKKPNNRALPFDQPRLENFIDGIFVDFGDLDKDGFKKRIIEKITRKEEIEASQITQYMILEALDNVSIEEPDWTYIAARIKLKQLYKEVSYNRSYDAKDKYGNFFGLIKTMCEKGIYTPELLEKYSKEEIDELGNHIDPSKDLLFNYIGLFTLADRYLKRDHDWNLYELPQERFMIIAMHLMINEDRSKRMDLVKEAYWALSNLYMTVATPTLANAGTTNSQFSSCFIDTVDDSLRGIYDSNTDIATLSKLGGGIGVYVSKIRSLGSDIRGYKGVSSGVVPWIRQLNNTAVSVDQLGTRTGAIAVYLDVWHKDIFDFLDLRLNNGDERRRAHDIFTGICIPDLFMEQVEKRGEWYLFDPHEIRQTFGWSLEDYYDEEPGRGSFREKYMQCVNHPNLSKVRVEAIDIVKRYLKSRLETGTPYLFFRDTVNRANPNKHAGMIYCSNLCVTGDTKLLTDKGYKTAKELYESGEELKVVIDNRTKSMIKSDYGTTQVDALKMHLTAKQADVYKVRTKEGFEIKATNWHKFYVEKDGKIEKVPLSSLNKGDKLLVQSAEGAFGTFDDVDLAYVVGVIAGDGCITDTTAKIYLYGDKKVHSEQIEAAVSKLISKYLDRSVKHNAKLEPKFIENSGRLVMSSDLLKYILEKFGVTTTTKRRIPNFVFEGTKEVQAAYLSGLYQMDGTVNSSKKYKACSIEISQTSKQLLQDIQLVLLNLGIYSTIYFVRKKGQYEMPDGKGGLKEYNCKQIYKLSIQDRKSRGKFMKLVEMKGYDVEKFEDFNSILKSKSRTPKHQYKATVESVEFHGVEDVYDTTQPEYNSLIFNGIVTGNCSEITQNQSPTIVLEEKLEDGKIVITKKPGDLVVCNLSSINLGRAIPDGVIERLIPIQVRMLDNVIDLNEDRIEVLQAVETNRKYRAIGLGTSGYHHLLAQKGIHWESEVAVKYSGDLYEMIAYHTIKASLEIAKEKGAYPLFPGSDWETGKYFDDRYGDDERWMKLKEEVKKHGLRNGYLLAVAPTGSTSIIAGTTASIDPIFSRHYYEEKKDYKIPVTAPSISPETMWYYKNAYTIDQKWSIKQNAARQKHIDQAISFNLYYPNNVKAKEMLENDMLAWKEGMKTIYYTRSTSSSDIEDCEACSS